MPSPLPSLTLPSPTPAVGKRRRSHSSLEILSLSPPYDIKRARVGIQELSTEDSPPLPSLVSSVSTVATAESPETQESASDTSSDELLDPTSTSSSGSSVYFEVDEGYDSDSESGDTSTSSSSTSYDSDEESSPRSTSLALSSPTPAQLPNLPTSSLSARLNAFLPNIAAANAQLDKERQQGTLGERDVEKLDDGHYIEMDLGLGVLEEKGKPGHESGEDSVNESSMDDPNDAEDESEITDGASLVSKKKKRVKRKPKDVMDKLMGRQKAGEGEKPGITVIEAGGSSP